MMSGNSGDDDDYEMESAEEKLISIKTKLQQQKEILSGITNRIIKIREETLVEEAGVGSRRRKLEREKRILQGNEDTIKELHPGIEDYLDSLTESSIEVRKKSTGQIFKGLDTVAKTVSNIRQRVEGKSCSGKDVECQTMNISFYRDYKEPLDSEDERRLEKIQTLQIKMLVSLHALEGSDNIKPKVGYIKCESQIKTEKIKELRSKEN